MGTRADFYVMDGARVDWLGSVAFDGCPEGFEDTPIFGCKAEADFRAAVAAELAGRDDATLPAQGWPWPWKDSGTTDYAYVFDAKQSVVSHYNYGEGPMVPQDGAKDPDAGQFPFPDMSAGANVTFGKRSGLLILGG